MINLNIFREYDIRGIVNQDINEQTTKLIGYFLGLKTKEKSKNQNPNIVIGYDARTHSPKIFKDLISGFNKAKCNIYAMGMVATGVNYFASFQKLNENLPDASVMITGSHNSKEYNGFKITINNEPFFGDEIKALAQEIQKNENLIIPDNHFSYEIDTKTAYIDYMVKEFSHLKNMKKKFVFDCGNGVANTVLSDILEKLNLNYEILYAKPDGNFPNHHPDPSEEKNLKDIKTALSKEFDYGFAYDGDADRIAFLTKQNNIKGDILALLFSKVLNNPVIIGEVNCTQIMYDNINKKGKAVMYKTGHSNLKVKLKELNADLAAEVSGHIFFNDRYYGFDDAIYATFRVMELIKNGMKIDEELKTLPKAYSIDELKIKTSEEEKFVLMDKIKENLKKVEENFPKILDIIEIDGVRIIFEKGWASIRASNTSPVLTTKFEATKEEYAKLYQEKLNELIIRSKNEISSTTNKTL